MGALTKPRRTFFIVGACAFLLILVPVSVSSGVRGRIFTFLQTPLSFSGEIARYAQELFYFHKNAEEARVYRQMFSQGKLEGIQSREIRLENERLARLLELKTSMTQSANRILYARVIARSPLAWNRTLWIDKGFDDGMRENLPVFSGEALAGKILEVRPGASKVILLTDPNCKIGVSIQRTRQQGILFGMASGECRMKYISVEADIKAGDRVQTAGLGVFFPKGIPVGEVVRAWKEPGQIYQVAQVKPQVNLGRVEEVAVLDVR